MKTQTFPRKTAMLLQMALLLLITSSLIAQVPQSFKYQAVLRDDAGQMMKNKALTMKVIIYEASVARYQETHSVITNEYGLVNIEIGKGSPLSGSIAAIDWSAGEFFLQTEINAGAGYVNLGRSQLLSVPYALHAKTADEIKGGITETDPLFGSSAASGITSGNITNWNAAHSWGNHATAGYLKTFSETDPVFGSSAAFGITSGHITNWNAAHSWGNHATAGYLTSMSETDPVFGSSSAFGITSGHITNWNAAHSWGNHALEGYLKTFSETDPVFGSSAASGITSGHITNWNSAHSWGNHATMGYLTSMSETDPVFGSSAASGITSGNISNWNSAHSWGNHATAGYLTTFSETDPTWTGAANATSAISRSGNVGIGVVTPNALLHTAGTGTGGGNVLFAGSFKTPPGAAPALGGGTRMMWYPDKAAFRAGRVIGANWDTDSIGNYSVAMGYETRARGNQSTALGYETKALGSTSFAAGYNSIASGNASVAIGDYATAYSGYEIVLGRYNTEYTPNHTTQWNSNDRLFVVANGISNIHRSNAMTILKNGRIGIGTSSPATQLHTTGSVRFEGAGIPGAGKVLTSDANGTATWQTGTQTYQIGNFAHGGIVFWVDATGQHGLVCAKTDQSTGVRWHAGTNTHTMARGDGPKAGFMNTAIIIANQGNGDGNTYAARICNELQVTEGGKTYGDWYLPSKEELNLMYQNRTAINATATANGGTGFASTFYWSSTEASNFTAWEKSFGTGAQIADAKNATYRVRAVRAF